MNRATANAEAVAAVVNAVQAITIWEHKTPTISEIKLRRVESVAATALPGSGLLGRAVSLRQKRHQFLHLLSPFESFLRERGLLQLAWLPRASLVILQAFSPEPPQDLHLRPESLP